MPADIHELLADAAGPIDARPDADAIWRAAQRRRRRRTAATAAGAAVVSVIAVLIAVVLARPPGISTIDPVQPPPATETGTATLADLGHAVLLPGDDRSWFDRLQRRDGSLISLPGYAMPGGNATMLADGTFVYRNVAPGDGFGEIWAVPVDGEPVRLGDAPEQAGQRLVVGRDATGSGVLIVVDGALERWTLDGRSDPVDELSPIGPPIDFASWDGASLAVATAATRVTVRSAATDARGSQVPVTTGEHAIRAVAHTGGHLLVLIDGMHDAAAEVVVLDPVTGEQRARHLVPSTADRMVSVAGMSVHDASVAVHVLRSSGTWADDSTPRWTTSLLTIETGSWQAVEAGGPVFIYEAPVEVEAG